VSAPLHSFSSVSGAGVGEGGGEEGRGEGGGEEEEEEKSSKYNDRWVRCNKFRPFF